VEARKGAEAMDVKSLRRRCEVLLRDVEIPEPFEVEAFAATVSRRRGRPLHLIPKGTGLGPCGVWLALPRADYVFFADDTTALHREHIILHELGHLICDHTVGPVMEDEVLRALLPSVEPATVRRALGRTRYSAVEEQAAEMIATLVRERAGRWVSPARSSDPAVSDVLARLQSTLGSRRRS
jgi:hypothetical protein